MKLNVIESNAEDLLYAALIAAAQASDNTDQKISDTRFLQCRFFHIAINDALPTVKSCLENIASIDEATLYVCADGDIIIKWPDTHNDIRDQIVNSILKEFSSTIKKYMQESEFFIDYDLLYERDQLRLECSKKLRRRTKQSKELAKYFTDSGLITTLQKTVKLTSMQRFSRKNPHILIVEDQIFSQKILTSILKDYTCYVADNVGEGLLSYIEKCPDIVLLDIDLPDLSGHHFASLLNNIDETSYVVMVTANHYEKDVVAAKKNKVRSFITKPYNKQVILNVIEQYKKSKKKRTTL